MQLKQQVLLPAVSARPRVDQSARCPASLVNSSSLQVCDQVCNLDSVMKFGFNGTYSKPQSNIYRDITFNFNKLMDGFFGGYHSQFLKRSINWSVKWKTVLFFWFTFCSNMHLCMNSNIYIGLKCNLFTWRKYYGLFQKDPNPLMLVFSISYSFRVITSSMTS